MNQVVEMKKEIAVASDNESVLSERANQLIASANSVQVADEESAAKAVDLTRLLKDHAKKVDSERRLIVDPLNQVVKHVNGRFKSITAPLAEGEKIIKSKILQFQREQEELKRKEAEERQKQMEKEQLEKAATLEAEGDIINANATLERMERTTVMPMEAPKPEGNLTGAKSSITRKWKPRIVDISQLVKAYPDVVEVKESKIMALFRAGIKDIPGVEFYQDESISIR